MITVQEAEEIILMHTRDYGSERVPLVEAPGRVLAEDIRADRALPPFNRATMDGIALSATAFAQGRRSFHIRGTQAAGDAPLRLHSPEECIEIMTGAAVPSTADAVVRYEDISISNGLATIHVENVRPGQNIHARGKDRGPGDTLATAPRYSNPAVISLAASVGMARLAVKKLPRVAIISSGDELVEVDQTPSPYQIRRSNNYALHAVLQREGIHAHMLHIPDDPAVIQRLVGECLENQDVVILSGGVSMGKFDYIPQALEALNVTRLFHKVRQRPGKPFWFGAHPNGALVFALPGNPVSGFMCLHRYFLPWLRASLGVPESPAYAVLGTDTGFTPPLQYFLQVQLSIDEQGQWTGTPVAGNGSGDFANLADTDAFMELPAEQDTFMKGEAYRVWRF